MSLTEALRAAAPEAFAALYDEHAGPLHAYCRIMVGDEAADAVRDTFVAIARHPDAVPADEDTLPTWLYAVARAESVRHGAFVRKPATRPMSDPLWRALAGLEGEDRDVLALAASLVPEEIAWVMDVSRDTAMTLVQSSRWRLEQAISSVGSQEAHTSMDDDTLRRLMTRMYEPPEEQRERVLSACAEAEHTADETLTFDADGMPVVLDPPTESAGDATHVFTEASPEDPDTALLSQEETAAATEAQPSAEDSPAEPEPDEDGTTPLTGRGRAKRRREPFRPRRIEGLLQVAGLAALVLVAVGVMAIRSDHSDSSSDDNGTGLSLERKHPASPSGKAVPRPQVPPSVPPSLLPGTAPPGTTPSTDPGAPLPPDDSTGAYPIPPPSYPNPPFHSRPPVHHSKSPIRSTTPTPTVSPTGKGSGTPTPHPSGS